MSKQFLGVTAAARELECNPATVRRWVGAGLLPAWRPHDRAAWKISREHIDAVKEKIRSGANQAKEGLTHGVQG